MITFLLFLLLATLLLNEERKRKDEVEEEEEQDYEAVLEDMIRQLHDNQVEIIKNKRSSLVLLKTIQNLINSIQVSYQAKLSKWEGELEKLKTLNRKIEAQINQCNEEDISKFDKVYNPIKDDHEDDKPTETENDINKSYFIKQTFKEQVQKEANKDDYGSIHGENINKTIGDGECPQFDLEQEMMKLPILRSILEKSKLNKNHGNLPKRRYEFSSEADYLTNIDCDSLFTTNQNKSRFSNNEKETQRTDNQYEGSSIMKYIQKYISPSVLSNVYNLSSLSTASKEKCAFEEVQQQNPIPPKVRFADDIYTENFRNKGYDNQGSSSVQSLLWYSGSCQPTSKSKITSCPQLFEYKLKQQRPRHSLLQESVGLRSYLECNNFGRVPNFDTEAGAESLEFVCEEIDRMNFESMC